jgi:hypothetical protein
MAMAMGVWPVILDRLNGNNLPDTITGGIMKHLIPALLLAVSIPSYAQYYPIEPVIPDESVTPDEPLVQTPVHDSIEGFNGVVTDNTAPINPDTHTIIKLYGLIHSIHN